MLAGDQPRKYTWANHKCRQIRCTMLSTLLKHKLASCSLRSKQRAPISDRQQTTTSRSKDYDADKPDEDAASESVCKTRQYKTSNYRGYAQSLLQLEVQPSNSSGFYPKRKDQVQKQDQYPKTEVGITQEQKKLLLSLALQQQIQKKKEPSKIKPKAMSDTLTSIDLTELRKQYDVEIKAIEEMLFRWRNLKREVFERSQLVKSQRIQLSQIMKDRQNLQSDIRKTRIIVEELVNYIRKLESKLSSLDITSIHIQSYVQSSDRKRIELFPSEQIRQLIDEFISKNRYREANNSKLTEQIEKLSLIDIKFQTINSQNDKGETDLQNMLIEKKNLKTSLIDRVERACQNYHKYILLKVPLYAIIKYFLHFNTRPDHKVFPEYIDDDMQEAVLKLAKLDSEVQLQSYNPTTPVTEQKSPKSILKNNEASEGRAITEHFIRTEYMQKLVNVSKNKPSILKDARKILVTLFGIEGDFLADKLLGIQGRTKTQTSITKSPRQVSFKALDEDSKQSNNTSELLFEDIKRVQETLSSRRKFGYQSPPKHYFS